MKTNFSDSGTRACQFRWPALIWVLCFLVLSPSLALAGTGLSAPDNLIYGVVVLGTNQVTADASAITVEARRADGMPVARYRMGERTDAGDFYLLTLKLEELPPLSDPASLLINETVTIAVVSNGVDRARQSFTISERGQVQRLDFGASSTNDLSGFELWAQQRGLDLNSQDLDADADGLSNLAEYIAGTSPTSSASAFLLSVENPTTQPRVTFQALRAQGAGYENRVRHYALQQLPDLSSGAWQTVPGFDDITGLNQLVVYEPAANAVPVFYRGVVWLDP